MNRESAARPVVVGVHPDVPDHLMDEAAAIAVRFGAPLVFGYVDTGRYQVEEWPDGSVASRPVDPDLLDAGNETFPDDLQQRLQDRLRAAGVAWETRLLAGDVAQALGRLADTLDAALIVVGTRNRSAWSTLHELFAGSIAAHLAHRQHRPVVVVPHDPVPADERLPWDQG